MLKVITSVRCLKKIYCCLNDTVSLHSFSIGVLGKQGGRYCLGIDRCYYVENYGCVELLDFGQEQLVLPD